MADSKDETGKGPSRPYATIDLKATEIGAKPAAAAGSGGKAGPGSGAGVAATLAWLKGRQRRLSGVLSHLAAGVLGGAVAVIAYGLISGLMETEESATRALPALTSRVAALERMLGGRATTADLAGRVEGLARTTGTLDATSARLVGEIKALQERVGTANAAAPAMAERVAKLENAITALTVSGGGEANEVVRTGLERFEREVAGAKAEAGQLAQRLEQSERQLRSAQDKIDGLKAELERGLERTARAEDVAPLAGRMAALDQELSGFVKTEADRTANTSRLVLALELSSLKRAIERGDGFAAELAAAKRVAGDRLNLAAFDRYAREGSPPLSELTSSFRKVANAMLDAESEPADASLFERLLSGAKSIVRVRKRGQPADDASLEATIARMETALKENRLGEVLAEAKKLPPKAQLAGEDWLRRVEMRYQIEQALAETEAALKKSLATPAGADRRQ